MKNQNRATHPTCRSRVVQSTLAALALLALPISAFTAGNNGNPAILPPQASPYGGSYGEWAGRWWAWTLSFPVTADPANGTAPLDSDQSGPVWFLATAHGRFDGSIPPTVVARQFTVPAGKALFFPVLTTWADNTECPVSNFDHFTPDELLALVMGAWDNLLNPHTYCTVDGVEVKGLDDAINSPYRVQSPAFSYTLASHDNLLATIFGLSCIPDGMTIDPAVTDGEFLMLAPLSVGHHTIHQVGSFGPVDHPFFLKDITYEIDVVPAN
jgi:hypothetical protein